MKSLSQEDKLAIGDKPDAGFDSGDDVATNIPPEPLAARRKFRLGQAPPKPELPNMGADNVAGRSNVPSHPAQNKSFPSNKECVTPHARRISQHLQLMFQLFYGGQQHGPYTLDQIKSMLEGGVITESALYWDGKEWEPIRGLLDERNSGKAEAGAAGLKNPLKRHALTVPKETTYGNIIWVVAILCWILVALSMIGLVYAALFALFLWITNGLLIARLRSECVLVTERQLPRLHSAFVEVCRELGVADVPELYILQSGGVLNAFTTRFSGCHFVVILSEMFEACGEDSPQMRFILGHELGHIKRNHVFKRIMMLPGFMVPLLGAAYSRACETTCDRHGAFVCGDMAGALAAMMLLAGGKRACEAMDASEFARQRAVRRGFFVSLHELVSGYPTLPQRVGNLLAIKHDCKSIEVSRNPLAYVVGFLFSRGGLCVLWILVMVGVEMKQRSILSQIGALDSSIDKLKKETQVSLGDFRNASSNHLVTAADGKRSPAPGYDWLNPDDPKDLRTVPKTTQGAPTPSDAEKKAAKEKIIAEREKVKQAALAVYPSAGDDASPLGREVKTVIAELSKEDHPDHALLFGVSAPKIVIDMAVDRLSGRMALERGITKEQAETSLTGRVSGMPPDELSLQFTSGGPSVKGNLRNNSQRSVAEVAVVFTRTYTPGPGVTVKPSAKLNPIPGLAATDERRFWVKFAPGVTAIKPGESANITIEVGDFLDSVMDTGWNPPQRFDATTNTRIESAKGYLP